MAIDLKKLFKVEEEVDTKSIGALLKAVKANAATGFDYLKFKHSVQSMEDMDMNQETAYKSTFATASTMGLSKAKLLKSAKKYLLVLDKENRLFSDSLNKQLTTRIQSKKSELKKIEDRLIANNKKIEELNKENQLLEKRLAEVNAQVEGNNDKLRETSAKFETALESLAKTIRQDVDLIEEYL